jgi:adenosylcobinamide-GDP ribazoletransferase
VVTGLLGAIQFLTRIPIRTRTAPPLVRSVPWFPVVGGLIGLVVGGVAASLAEVVAPGVAAAVAIVVGMLVTGAFHEDGLADLADAVAGGATRERRLEILKDPRHGTYGVAALAGSVLVRWSALAALVTVGPRHAILAAVAAHALARGIAVAVMGVQPAASTPGLGADWMADIGMRHAAIGLLLGTAVTVLAAGWWSSLVVAVGVVLAATIVRLARRTLGGVSGDVLGAIEQVVEAAALVTLAATTL